MHAPAAEPPPASEPARGPDADHAAGSDRTALDAPESAPQRAPSVAATAADPAPPTAPVEEASPVAAEADKRRSLWDVISRRTPPAELPTPQASRPAIGWEETAGESRSAAPPDARPARDSVAPPVAEPPPEPRAESRAEPPRDERPRVDWQDHETHETPASIAWSQHDPVDRAGSPPSSDRPRAADVAVDPGPRPVFAPPRRDEAPADSGAPPASDGPPAWLRGAARGAAGITFEATDAPEESVAESAPAPLAAPAARYVSDDEIDPEILAGFLDEPVGPAGIAFEEVAAPGAEGTAAARWVPDSPDVGVFTGFVPDDQIDGGFVPDDDEFEPAAHGSSAPGGVTFEEAAPHEAPRYYAPGAAEPSAPFGAAAGTAAPARPSGPTEPVVPTWSRPALAAAGLGVLAIPLAGLAALPHVAWRVPALVFGLFGMSVGYLAVSECRRARGRRLGRSFAWTGVVAGLAGMFLGPLVMTRYGDSYRKARARAESTARLERIGTALADFHARDRRFPAGCTVEISDDGNRLPLHGWMTQLLPYVDEVDLHRAIDLQQPFDADVNLRAMQTTVAAFQTPDGSLERVGRGYAVAHFAGVGGSKTVGPKTVQYGLFDVGSRTAQDDVKDGLSTTLAVGEVGSNIPPWGDPHNWRQPGRGINRENNGFGNADRTGALFLFADGSVRFLSNKTNPQVLEHLATRNGGEEIQANLP
jgi:hypothetical protein